MADPKLFNLRQKIITRDHKLIAIFALFLGGFVGRAIIDAAGAAATLGVGAGMVFLGSLLYTAASSRGSTPSRNSASETVRGEARARKAQNSKARRKAE